MKTLVAVAALAILALAAPAQAQATLDLTSAGPVAFMGSGSFAFTLSIACAEFLGDPTAEVTIDVTDPPAWLNATPPPVDLSLGDCDPVTGLATTEGEIPFTVSASAPAVVQHTVHAKATLGETESNEPAATYMVAYRSNYTLTPSATFPLTVTNRTTSFAATGVQASNAPSMIMVDGFGCDSGALISGIGPLQYANKAGTPDTKTYTVTFTAPEEDWERATCTLKVYGHYNFDGMAGDPTDQKTSTWEFVNGGVHEDHDDDDGKKSPAPVGALIALGLLGFAALLRRRQG